MTVHQNHYLFSDYYLNEILPGQGEWKAENIQESLEESTTLFQEIKEFLPGSNEAQTEEKFIRPVLRLLGHVFEVQPLVETAFGTRTPDYAFFPEEETIKKAHKFRGKKDYFKNALAIGDAKYWDRPLDKKLSNQGDPFESNNPSFQIDTYLRSTETRWGILTNGRLWRLYNRDTSYRLDTYYQVDLVQLLEQADAESFKYFYLFFRREAFLPTYQHKTFLDLLYSESIDYAKRVGAELKENVYESLRLLATGFLKMDKNGLGTQDLEDVRSNSLVLLYRLLFIFYAEARNLLPLDNPSYKNTYSLDSLRKEIKEKLARGETLAPEATLYWNHLKGLFDLINSGSNELGVPAYNGGLFKPENHPFLEMCVVGDSFLVRVIDNLARSTAVGEGKVFVDYRSLDVRDLGSIYEGLLEYHLRLADEDLLITKKDTYLPLKEADKKANAGVVRKGELYLVTDKGERKATGSYYTPEYIVNYIVENTLCPTVEKIEADIKQRCDELGEKIKASRGSNREAHQKELEQAKTSFDDEVLKLKVLDPAMGSGHFLVRATEFLAEHIATNPYSHDVHAPGDESAIDYWKRRVVEHCIYGVDVNPLAVELAKLSLWLKTVARGKPLSFLDHHLRIGNSLIGAQMKDLTTLPEVRIKGSKSKGSRKTSQAEQIEFDYSGFKTDMSMAVKEMQFIEDLPSDSINDINKKSEVLAHLDHTRRDKYRRMADLWTSTYFGNELSAAVYQAVLYYLQGKGPVMTPEKEIEQYLSNAQSLSSQKHFFHWELEFPEVFFDQFGKRLENPGFDVVMGNPPYVRIHELPFSERNYYNGKFECAYKQYDIYILFFEKGIGLLRAEGNFGFIASSKFLTSDYGENLRRHILKHCSIKNIVDVSTAGVFGEAAIYPYIFILKGEKEEGKRSETIITFTRCNSEVQLLEKRTKVSLIPQEIFHQRSGEVFSLQPIEVLEIFRSCERNSLMLGGVCKITRGFRPPPEDLLREKGDGLQKLLYGDEMAERYAIVWRGTHLEYIPERIPESKPKQVFEQPKILIRDISLRPEAYLDKEGFYCLKTIYIIEKPKANYSLEYITSLINSRLLDFYFRSRFYEAHIGSEYLRFREQYLKSLPLHRIAFVTPEGERKRMVEEAKRIYKEGSVKEFKDLLEFVEERLAKNHEPARELVKNHNAEEINKDWQIPEDSPWEQSDVVHDILAFLAEEMIMMNKEKQEEIKGFLGWLESELDAKIDEMKGKTKIKEYGEEDFDRLWDALKANAKLIGVSLGKDFHNKLKDEFDRSESKLGPLIERIEETDWLIDQIVYKLYGLTEEEIEVVEKGSRV